MKYLFIIAMLYFWTLGCQNVNSSESTKHKETILPVKLLSEHSNQSLYQITDQFETQDGDSILLSELEGKTVLLSMIYTSCAGACPRLVADLQNIEKKLGNNEDKVHFLLISFDTVKDTAAVLKQYAGRHQLNKNWTLLHGSKEAVRTLSVLLNVSYAKEKNGIYTHENKISLLDKQGILRYQEEGLENTPDKMLQALSQLVKE